MVRVTQWKPFVRSAVLIGSGALVLLLNSPVARSATPAALGQIVARGTADINGVTALSGTTVFPNDRVTTRQGAIAYFSLRGERELILMSSSSLELKNSLRQLTAELNYGKVIFVSPPDASICIQAGDARIVPGAGGGVYDVALTDDGLEVTARRGSAEIQTSSRTMEISAGMKLEAILGSAQPSDAKRNPGLKLPIVKFAIVPALVAGGAILAVSTIDSGTTCSVSSDLPGNCTNGN
jgi:ferric-dicitrate binding protein FerR (iron transport regulator)